MKMDKSQETMLLIGIAICSVATAISGYVKAKNQSKIIKEFGRRLNKIEDNITDIATQQVKLTRLQLDVLHRDDDNPGLD